MYKQRPLCYLDRPYYHDYNQSFLMHPLATRSRLCTKVSRLDKNWQLWPNIEQLLGGYFGPSKAAVALWWDGLCQSLWSPVYKPTVTSEFSAVVEIRLTVLLMSLSQSSSPLTDVIGWNISHCLSTSTCKHERCFSFNHYQGPTQLIRSTWNVVSLSPTLAQQYCIPHWKLSMVGSNAHHRA